MTRRRKPKDANPTPHEARPSRREFLVAASTLLLGSACSEVSPLAQGDRVGDASDLDSVDTVGGVDGADSAEDLHFDTSTDLSDVPPAPGLPGAPFTLGVASGDPAADGFVLWTRLAPEPMAADGLGGMPGVDVPVIWEVALDDAFTRIVAAGWVWATPTFAHTVHVEVTGLAPDHGYVYRFRVGDAHTSPAGRSRSFPPRGAPVERLRLGLTTCQNLTHGYFTAHAHLALEDVDAVLFCGDYIYESGGGGPVRQHDGGDTLTLADYRRRYAQYKLDPDLQACHAALPWIATWDDHEVRNNYAGSIYLRPDGSMDDLAERRAAAYQAWWEHQPVRVARPALPVTGLTIHRRVDFGDLATIHVLDGRQYRSPQACNGVFGELCEETTDPSRTMLGAEQRAWLETGLRENMATWNVLAQQTIFWPMTGGGLLANVDQWDGYAAERDALVEVFAEPGVRNVLVCTGDFHASGLGTLHTGGEDASTPRVGVEVMTTSISSTPNIDSIGTVSTYLERYFDHVHHFNGARRGYAVLDIDHGGVRVDFKVVSTVTEPVAELTIDETWTIAAETYETERIRE